MSGRKKIEERTAETILQRPSKVAVGGREYEVAPPSLATLILVSEAVSRLPEIDPSPDDVAVEVLRTAKDCYSLAEVAAILILGAKRIRRGGKILSLFGKSELKTLSERIAHETSPSELSSAIAGILSGMEIGDFFGLTTFLGGANLTKGTREVVKGTTASGR